MDADRDPRPGAGDDGPDGDADDGPGGDPLRFRNWLHRSAAGAVVVGLTRGLREALEAQRNDPAIVMEAAGQPEDEGPITLHFDPDDPTATVAVIRSPAPAPPVPPPPPVPPAPLVPPPVAPPPPAH